VPPDLFARSGIIRGKSFAKTFGPGALPHHGVINGFAAFPFPDQGCFPLVGNSGARDGGGIYPRPAYGPGAGGEGVVVDFFRVVGYPALA
jgi:hypothetical protein